MFVCRLLSQSSSKLRHLRGGQRRGGEEEWACAAATGDAVRAQGIGAVLRAHTSIPGVAWRRVISPLPPPPLPSLALALCASSVLVSLSLCFRLERPLALVHHVPPALALPAIEDPVVNRSASQ
eukprot:3884857-Rhodomonas_salina.1